MHTAVKTGSFRKAAAAVGLAVCWLAGTAGAQTPNTAWYSTSGTSFTISSADQLAGLAEIVNGKAAGIAKDDFTGKTVTLSKNIDLAAAGYDNWVPIGDSASVFSGTFDGGGFVISNLTINRPDKNYQGLFGNVDGAVKNIGLENVNVKGQNYVGGLVGLNGSITECYAAGTVDGRSQVGGLMGGLGIGNVVNNYSACTVNGVKEVGGVVGRFTGGILNNNYSIGLVSGDSSVGGIVGYRGERSGMQNCAALNPEVRALTGNAGRVVGNGTAGIGVVAFSGMKNKAGNTDWENKGADNLDGADISAGAIHLDNTIKGLFKAANGWTFKNGSLPGLLGSAVPMPEHLKPDDYLWYVDNLASKTFTISTAGELAALAHIVNGTWGGTPANDGFSTKTITLNKDVNLSGYSNWTPIGESGGGFGFGGRFDGGGHVISNLTINRPGADCQGLFGIASYGGTSIKNLGLENVNIRGQDKVGGLVGHGAIVKITNCYTTGTVRGRNEVGGLVGESSASRGEGADVYNSYSTCAVTGAEGVGGIVGKMRASVSLLNCYSTGVITGVEKVGGIVGALLYGVVKNCAALNPEVKAVLGDAGRVVSGDESSDSSVAFAEMKNFDGDAVWANKGADKQDGADIAIAAIKADGTIGGFFIADSGWTLKNGDLPGLFGKSVPLPVHLGGAVSVLAADRVIRQDAGTAVAPVPALLAEFTAGPNPAGKSGIINFYRQGSRVDNGKLTVYDASGNVVRKITIRDAVGALRATPETPRRQVGFWDLKDNKGRMVSDGTYLVKGVLKSPGGKAEKVSLVVGVR